MNSLNQIMNGNNEQNLRQTYNMSVSCSVEFKTLQTFRQTTLEHQVEKVYNCIN